MSDKTRITLDEYFAELDKLRQPCGEEYTEDIFKIIRHARTGEHKVPYSKIVIFLDEKGFGKFPKTTLHEKYNRMCKKRGLDKEE